jgi:hypothetical protein
MRQELQMEIYERMCVQINIKVSSVFSPPKSACPVVESLDWFHCVREWGNEKMMNCIFHTGGGGLCEEKDECGVFQCEESVVDGEGDDDDCD